MRWQRGSPLCLPPEPGSKTREDGPNQINGFGTSFPDYFKPSVLAVGLAACGGNSNVSSLNAAGASFPAKVYQIWFADLAGSGGLMVNYQAVGSGAGRKAFIDGTVDFAASDDPIKAADRKQVSQGTVQIPMVGGTIAFG